ncbi:DUF2470 domain-containing protein [Gordonia zhaorongruii]|uniref:DUF2470 domain-containing protein n=1 Tax=Gordonia zhaorongruii TaxID=2597659 RepID=UPI001044264B|nr:DUF2470 domain-containing protein [Gordonia zhaorongruii]
MNSTGEPSDAEIIQTACRRAVGGTLSVDRDDAGVPEAVPSGTDSGACDSVAMIHLFEGDAFLLVPDECSARAAADTDAGTSAMLEVIDCAPLRLRERVRSLVWLTGTLHPIPMELQRELAIEIATEHADERLLDVGHGYSMIRMAIGSAVVATPTGAGAVDVVALATAAPDMFWEYESDWLAHLESDHADLVHQLARRIPETLRNGRVRPLSLDRFGITFRVESADSDEDFRLSFSRPVARVVDLSAALHALALHPALDHQR